MNACQPIERPDYRKYRLLREALVDVRALVPPGTEDPYLRTADTVRPAAKGETMNTEIHGKWNAGLRLDGVANIAVMCAGVAIVVVAAAADGLNFTLQALA
jgi:hypothetical protein